MKKEVKKIISDLKKYKITIRDIPDEIKDDWDLIVAERRMGLRTIGRRGYDVIDDSFFVEEKIDGSFWKAPIKRFDNFTDYFNYVEGNIYENACYYQYTGEGLNESVDLNRMLQVKSLVDNTIDQYTLTPSEDERQNYDVGKKRKEQCRILLEKYKNCSTVEELKEVEAEFQGSGLPKEMFEASKDQHSDQILYYYHNMSYRHEHFFIWQLVQDAKTDENKFDLLMDYFSDYTCSDTVVRELCLLFDPEIILERYKYEGKAKTSKQAQRNRLRKFIRAIENDSFEKTVRVYLDKATHFYCEESRYSYRYDNVPLELRKKNFFTYRYFDSIIKLYDYRAGDFTNTDLSMDYDLEFKFDVCFTDETTVLPPKESDDINYEVTKKYLDGAYEVVQRWKNNKGALIKEYHHRFEFFFDFVAFLKGDLSGADLLLCEGFRNLKDTTGLILQNAKLPSKVQRNAKRKGKFDYTELSFPEVIKNEKVSTKALVKTRGSAISAEFADFLRNEKKVYLYYISDLHLLHQLQKLKNQDDADIEYVVRKAAHSIVSESPGVVVMDGGKRRRIILIGGDTSSDFQMFCRFVKALKNELSLSEREDNKSIVIFLLGNHELWPFENESFGVITQKYRKVIHQNGMYLLQNDILCLDPYYEPQIIYEDTINQLSDMELHNIVTGKRLVILGGLGFSGYNESFNANHGIYRNAINREMEIAETKKFEALYWKTCLACYDSNLVIFTHTPQDCWKKTEEYSDGVVYVSGHTHKNVFFDNKKKRIYADNQIGYNCKGIHMKWLSVDANYNNLSDYEDGIHNITPQEYVEFYLGRNKPISFSRKVRAVYLLKKSSYYCFICKTMAGTLCIMNGGAIRKLPDYPIEYFYDNMDKVIGHISNPLAKYTSLQNKVAAEVIRIGGAGNIHGCIVDIDFYNHIYINPVDSKLTAYWAEDMVTKKVYPTIPGLLKAECPKLYSNYRKLISGSKGKKLYLSKQSEEIQEGLDVLPQEYLETDIYRASKEVCKMQKLYDNILTIWIDKKETGKTGGGNVIEKRKMITKDE